MTDATTIDQRYYASTYGRFNTADQSTSSAGPSDPVSWNRYSYTGGDPVNRRDPHGTDWCDPDSGNCFLGSAPGGPPACGGIYQNAALGDFSSDAATFWGQAQAMGCLSPFVVPFYNYPTGGPPPPQVCTAEVGLTADQTDAVETILGENSWSYIGLQAYGPIRRRLRAPVWRAAHFDY